MRAACVRVSRRPHGAGEGVRTWAGNWRWTFSPCAEIGRTGETTGRASSGQGARDRLTVAESVDAALMTLGAAGGSVRLSAIPSEDGTLFSISGILHRREQGRTPNARCDHALIIISLSSSYYARSFGPKLGFVLATYVRGGLIYCHLHI